ncbi:MAG: 16S rRNA (guanine(966)-N(2))-methyltransferase RsmD [Desulfofustis sp.]|nr:16S rRNA (guanine(966)-N(2))-methyltransferase RsmD [Desulfofustis sp.]
MRIISGSAKGRKLFSPKHGNSAIRPTSDRAREALFSIIGNRVVDCSALDLFAGTGAFGCEALSRGAAEATFVDKSRVSLGLINKNITLIPGGPGKSKIIISDLTNGISGNCLSKLGENRFDLIFADPPYLTDLSLEILSSLDNSAVLSSNPLIIIEERKNFEPPARLNKLYLSDRRSYGESSFYFYNLSVS